MANGGNTAHRIGVLLKAKYPIIAVLSSEEFRVETALKQIAREMDSQIRFWSCTEGITEPTGDSVRELHPDKKALPAALDIAMKTQERALYVFRDPHPFLVDAAIRRKVRDAARLFKRTPKEVARAAIFLAPDMKVHPDLQSAIHVEGWPLPGREELTSLLTSTAASLHPSVSSRVPEYDADRVVSAALGLTVDEAHNAFSRSLVEKVAFDPDVVLQQKKQVVLFRAGLEWIEPVPGGFDAVGGMEVLKVWLEQRRQAWSPEGRAAGLPSPRGIFLAGMMGCGKSYIAKAIAAAWNLALLRLSVAAQFGGILGETESNLRRALETAEAVAPCVLLLDEIDKALGDSGERDGGTAKRIRGELLTWLQERKSEVFVVASANNVEQMAETSPEMMRKGRWDELFFVDQPSPREVEQILRVHCAKRRLTLGGKLDAAVEAMQGFSGAEIEAVLVDAQFRAFADKRRKVALGDLVHEAKRTVPMSVTARARIGRLREWGKAHARSASLSDAPRESGKVEIEA